MNRQKEIFSKIGKTSQNPEILNYLGLFDLENMNFVEAIKVFQKAANLDKSNSKYYYNLETLILQRLDRRSSKSIPKKLCISILIMWDYRYSLAYLFYDMKDFVKPKRNRCDFGYLS